MINLHNQRGLTFISFLFMAAIGVFAALLTMKLAPAYMEYFTIQKILHDIDGNPNIGTMSNAEIRTLFGKRAIIDNISTVKPTDLEISREDGKSVIKAEYIYQTKLLGNVSLLVEFKASSSGGSSSAQ